MPRQAVPPSRGRSRNIATPRIIRTERSSASAEVAASAWLETGCATPPERDDSAGTSHNVRTCLSQPRRHYRDCARPSPRHEHRSVRLRRRISIQSLARLALREPLEKTSTAGLPCRSSALTGAPEALRGTKQAIGMNHGRLRLCARGHLGLSASLGRLNMPRPVLCTEHGDGGADVTHRSGRAQRDSSSWPVNINRQLAARLTFTDSGP
jgi:hypothetical protein